MELPTEKQKAAKLKKPQAAAAPETVAEVTLPATKGKQHAT